MSLHKKSMPVVVVEDVHKSFRLPHEQHNTLKSSLLNFTKKSYEDIEVLKGLNFKVSRGEFFGIVGRNGGGKSTLLKLLAGIYVPTKGKIEVRGRLTPFIELGVGFNPELTGRDNVYLNGALLGMSRQEIDKRYDEIVSFAELQKFMDQKLKNYSSGMQVRLAFSIAIQSNSEILLFDEVLAVGDVNFQEKCYNYFREIKGQGRTVIYVSHDLRSVEQFCDRVLMINKGEAVAMGEASMVVKKYSGFMEDERAHDKTIKVVTDEGTHYGSFDVEVASVKVLNHTGKAVKKLQQGEPFSIKVDYIKNQPVEDVQAIITIFDSHSGKLITLNTEESQFKVDSSGDKGFIQLDFKESPLAAFKYKVNVGLFRSGFEEAYDHFRDATTFEVVGGPENTREARIVVDYEWSCK